jgi:hypothetical protein
MAHVRLERLEPQRLSAAGARRHGIVPQLTAPPIRTSRRFFPPDGRGGEKNAVSNYLEVKNRSLGLREAS